jgi:hypothetical protein
VPRIGTFSSIAGKYFLIETFSVLIRTSRLCNPVEIGGLTVHKHESLVTDLLPYIGLLYDEYIDTPTTELETICKDEKINIWLLPEKD